jgi:hypothetical protein
MIKSGESTTHDSDFKGVNKVLFSVGSAVEEEGTILLPNFVVAFIGFQAISLSPL